VTFVMCFSYGEYC